MFGYIKEYTPEVKVKEHLLYRALYCSLCRSMGKCTGQCSRLSLSYDAVFLILIRDAVTGTAVECEPKRCFLHPFRKRDMAKPNDNIVYAAKASALMTDGVLRDRIADAKGIRPLGYRLLSPFTGHARKKANLPSLGSTLDSHLKELSDIEKSGEARLDEAADAFGKYLAAVFTEGLEGDAKRIASAIGYRTGRYIYLIDALDDFGKDKASGAYNPLRAAFGDTLTDKVYGSLHGGLLHELTEIGAALDLTAFPDEGQKALVYNIVFERMKRTADELCKQRSTR